MRLPRHLTKTKIRHFARQAGATDPRVETSQVRSINDGQQACSIVVCVDLPVEARDMLQKQLRSWASSGTRVNVEQKTNRTAPSGKLEVSGGEVLSSGCDTITEKSHRTVDDLKQSYVRGDIGLLELESELEEAVDPEPIAVSEHSL